MTMTWLLVFISLNASGEATFESYERDLATCKLQRSEYRAAGIKAYCLPKPEAPLPVSRGGAAAPDYNDEIPF